MAMRVATPATDDIEPVSARQQRSTGHYVFVAGATSGIVEGLVVQPLEMLKTRFQINTGARMRLLPAARDIIAEGGVRQLYRGGLPEITGLMPRAAASLATLEFAQRRFRAATGGELTAPAAYAAGVASGVSEAIAFSPFQVIKVRLMAKEHLGRYRNTFDCLAKVVRAEGLSALAIGLAPTLLRNCIWNSVYYGTMEELDKRLQPMDSGGAQLARTLALGVAVGMTATCLNAPFDVVKSRFQSQLPAEVPTSSGSGGSSVSGGRTARYSRVLPTLATIWREEGPRALYKGFVPKALRLGIGQTIGLVTFRKMLNVLGAEDEQ